MAAAVELEGVNVTFGDFVAVRDANLTIEPGEFFSFLGPSGCGKTTLLRTISGFIEPTRGQVKIGGQDMKGIGPNKRPTALIFQNLALFPMMTVAENIGYGLRVRGVPRHERDEKVKTLLIQVALSEHGHKKVSELSGGQKQRVAIARALAVEPSVLLLDEPLSALDYKLRKEMQIELKRMQSETGITFIFVTHDQEEALTMSDRIAVMSKGRVLQVGTPWDIYDKPAERFVADFIGETNFLSAAMVGIEEGVARVRLPSGIEISASLAEGYRPAGEATVVVRPEHARMVTTGGQLSGVVENIVYFGTDTHIHVKLDQGSTFMVRQQNSRSKSCGASVGDRVGIDIAPDAAQVLRD
jgi:spermidine/putrescine transport system ATP-binding protein